MIPSRASRQYRCQHKHAVPSLLWHAEFRFRSFIYFNSPLLQQAYKTARPDVCPSPPPAPAATSFRRHRRRSRPRPRGQRARPRRHGRRPRPPAPAAASARCRRCCSLSSPSQRSPLLRRGRPRRWRPPRPRLRRHCRRRNSTAGNLPKAYQIMRNDATWKMNRYLCSVKIHVTMGVSRSQILLQIRNIAKPRNVHEKIIGAISSVNSP